MQDLLEKILRLSEGIDRKVRSTVNASLDQLLKGYHETMMLDDIKDVLEQYDLIMLDEDGTEHEAIFTGEDGKAEVELGDVKTQREDSGNLFYDAVDNTNLILSWHKMESGKWEIGAYLS